MTAIANREGHLTLVHETKDIYLAALTQVKILKIYSDDDSYNFILV
ncbi:hypothetical protein [Neomoorella thermoacetica]|nr:hypothetical protein [Moorella thermoacetica]